MAFSWSFCSEALYRQEDLGMFFVGYFGQCTLASPPRDQSSSSAGDPGLKRLKYRTKMVNNTRSKTYSASQVQ